MLPHLLTAPYVPTALAFASLDPCCCCCCCCCLPIPTHTPPPPTPTAVEEEGDPNSTEVDGLSFLVEDAEEGADDEELDPAAIEIVDDIPAEVRQHTAEHTCGSSTARKQWASRGDDTQCTTCTAQHTTAQHSAMTCCASTAVVPYAARQLQGQV